MLDAWPFMIPIVAILAGCTVAIVGTLARNRVRELEIRERIAMIERGWCPRRRSIPAASSVPWPIKISMRIRPDIDRLEDIDGAALPSSALAWA